MKQERLGSEVGSRLAQSSDKPVATRSIILDRRFSFFQNSAREARPRPPCHRRSGGQQFWLRIIREHSDDLEYFLDPAAGFAEID